MRVCACTLLQLLVTKELYKAEILVVARNFCRTFRQTGVRKHARLLREIYLLKIDPLSVVQFLVERICSFLEQPSLCACRRGVAAASTIQLPR